MNVKHRERTLSKEFINCYAIRELASAPLCPTCIYYMAIGTRSIGGTNIAALQKFGGQVRDDEN